MKKLMIKVFLVIFILFSTFTLILCTASVVRGYLERKKSINEILTRLPKSFDFKAINNGELNDEINSKGPNEFDRKIFLDSTIYTVVLDENGEYEGVINHMTWTTFSRSTKMPSRMHSSLTRISFPSTRMHSAT